MFSVLSPDFFKVFNEFLRELFVALVWLLAFYMAAVAPVPFPHRWWLIGGVFAAGIGYLINYARKND